MRRLLLAVILSLVLLATVASVAVSAAPVVVGG